MTIEITDAAKQYIQAAIEKKSGFGFRLSIKKTGCSGFAYQPSVVETVNSGDTATVVNGITLYLDPLWMHLLASVRIDFVEETKSGLKQKRLMIENKQEAGRCGCGESFHLANDKG